MKRLYACALLLVAFAAQPASAQTRRAVTGLQLWPEVQAELALPDNDYLVLAVRGQQETDNNGFSKTNRALGFDARRVTVGYEHFWSEHWSVGGTLGYVSASKTYTLLPEVLLRHRSALGPLTFGQRLSLERFIPGASGATSRTDVRLRVDLEKILATGSIALRPRLSYEASTQVRLLRDDNDRDKRTIDFTSLRGEVGVRISPLLDLTPWFAYQTQYSISLPSFDEFGNVKVPGGRANAVAPVVGLDLRFTFLQGQDAASRQQLPTQH